MARDRKVAKKNPNGRRANNASKSKGDIKTPASAYSMRSSGKNKVLDRRGVEYRERLNRATKLVIDLHREALKDLEKH